MQIILLKGMTERPIKKSTPRRVKLRGAVLAFRVTQGFPPEQKFPADLAVSARDHIHEAGHQIQVCCLQI